MAVQEEGKREAEKSRFTSARAGAHGGRRGHKVAAQRQKSGSTEGGKNGGAREEGKVQRAASRRQAEREEKTSTRSWEL